MNKKTIIIILCIFLILVLGVGAFFVISDYNKRNTEKNNENKNNQNNEIGNETGNEIVFNEVDNSQIITTNSNSTLRIINYYDEEMFKGKNTILFMWASWCPHCATELDALNEILAKYKDDPDFDIVFIAHEYKDSGIDGLLELLEGGTVDYDTEVLVDFGRVIRHAIDPEAGTVPRTYFLDKDLNVLYQIADPITADQIDSLIQEYYK